MYSAQCRVVDIQSERPVKTSLSDGVDCTRGSCVANLWYSFEFIAINSVCSTQCRVVDIQSERLIAKSLSDGVNCTHSGCVANVLYRVEMSVINSVFLANAG